MKNVTAVTTNQAIKTTVVLEFVTAPVIRCVARRDMPEAGITEGSVFYLIRSSKNDGTYYIATWDYERVRWNCSCPATTNNCRHHRLVKADCAKSHTVQGYKPATVNKAEVFAGLKARYDVRELFAIGQARETLKRVPFERAHGYHEMATQHEAFAHAILSAPAGQAHATWKAGVQATVIGANGRPMEQAPSGRMVLMR